jgi:nicotinamidase-related amidase
MMKQTTTKTKKKRIVLRVLILSLGLIVTGGATLVLTGFSINAPTKGEPIKIYNNPKAALLVVDMQNDTTNNPMYRDTSAFLRRVNSAIAEAEKQGMEILYIKNEYEGNPIVTLISGGRYAKGTEGAELDANLQMVNDNIFTKSVGDSFSNASLEAYLQENQVDTLFIAGADAGACVFSTAQGAQNRGYNVNVLRDAIITVDDATMSTMLKEYEKSGIGVVETADMTN